MNYSAMIQNRKSVRAFRGKEVPNEALAQLRTYYEKTCPRLVPEIATELIVLDKDAQPALESSAATSSSSSVRRTICSLCPPGTSTQASTPGT